MYQNQQQNIQTSPFFALTNYNIILTITKKNASDINLAETMSKCFYLVTNLDCQCQTITSLSMSSHHHLAQPFANS